MHRFVLRFECGDFKVDKYGKVNLLPVAHGEGSTFSNYDLALKWQKVFKLSQIQKIEVEDDNNDCSFGPEKMW